MSRDKNNPLNFRKSNEDLTPEAAVKMLDLFVDMQALYTKSDLPTNIKGGAVIEFMGLTLLTALSDFRKEGPKDIATQVTLGAQAFLDVNKFIRALEIEFIHSLQSTNSFGPLDAYKVFKRSLERESRSRIPDRENIEDPTPTINLDDKTKE